MHTNYQFAKMLWVLALLLCTGVMKAQQVVDVNDFALSWPLGKGTADVTAAQVSQEGLFSVAEYGCGKLTISTQRAAGTSQQTLYKPSQQSGVATDDDALSFSVKPKKGLTFTPQSLSFEASRWGTGGGKFDVVAVVGNRETTLATGVLPEYGNSGLFTACNYDLSKLPVVSDDLLVLKIRIYSLATNKEYGFGNVVLKGHVAGTPQSVASYTMSVGLGTEGAGSVTCNPAGNQFDEGTRLTVSATENFGYHFAAWVDAAGAVVSTDNPYSFDIQQNTELVATYTKKNVYALNLQLQGGANANLVQFAPEGNVLDGVHYYEEGTDVKLTAQNNLILTFTNWEDNTTAVERNVKMDGNKNLTACFSAIDYIVGWDFYDDAPKSERAADYKADTENAGLLSLRKADGTTTSWLANGVAAGKVQGRYGIRVWRPLEDKYYFEISFSSNGYQHLTLSAAVGDDYNAHSIVNVQYSIDGTTFTTFGTYELPNRGWTDGKFELPAEADNQQRVWIRFLPDFDSPLVGVARDADGTMLTDVFVLANATGAADEVATLLSTNPEQNAKGVSASGSVILNFDHKVKAGTGSATLNGEALVPIVSGKTAIFRYSGLKYATSYTFSMPEGVLLSRSDKPVAAASIDFTTMERVQPDKRLYDAVVAADGSGDYTSVQAAVDAAPQGRAKPWLIFVKNGQYKEHVDIPATKPYLHFIGQDRDLAVIKDDRMAGGPNALHVSLAATVVVNADNIFFENITLENTYGHEMQDGPQALALNTIGDRIALNNVALLSYQDTWITTSAQKNRHYIKNSLIEGAVDFIYNGGDVYLDGDTLEINRPSGGYIVAPNHTAETKWGYVFQNNVIRPGKTKTGQPMNVTDVWLGRPWHNQPKTVFINTQTFVNLPAKGWYNTMGGLPVLWAEYNTVDKNGNPVDLSQRETYYYYTDRDTGEKFETFGVKNTLTAEEAAQYTLKNVVGGSDNWQPDLMCEPCDAPVVTMTGNQLSWHPVPYAICYVVTRNGHVAGMTTETSFDVSAAPVVQSASGAEAVADVWQVQAVNEFGGLSQKSTVGGETPSGLELRVVSSQAETVDFFTPDGRRHSCLTRGLNIVRMSNGIVRKSFVM